MKKYSTIRLSILLLVIVLVCFLISIFCKNIDIKDLLSFMISGAVSSYLVSWFFYTPIKNDTKKLLQKTILEISPLSGKILHAREQVKALNENPKNIRFFYKEYKGKEALDIFLTDLSDAFQPKEISIQNELIKKIIDNCKE